MTWTVSISPVFRVSSTFAGSQRFTLTPKCADQALALQVVDRALPAVVARPGVFPDVELLEVDGRDAQVRQALLGVFADVVGGKAVVEREAPPRGPLQVLGRDLGRGVEPLAGVPRRAGGRGSARSCPRHSPRRCRRSCSRARPSVRARRPIRRRRSRSSPPGPTSRSRSRRPASPCAQTRGTASSRIPPVGQAFEPDTTVLRQAAKA